MNLNEIRTQIDTMDREILELFQKRMDLCKEVAAYKKENNLPIFQEEREVQILNKMENIAADDMKTGVRELFTVIMDISKQLQMLIISSDEETH